MRPSVVFIVTIFVLWLFFAWFSAQSHQLSSISFPSDDFVEQCFRFIVFEHFWPSFTRLVVSIKISGRSISLYKCKYLGRSRATIAVWKNCLTLYASKYSDMQKIGDFCMVFNEQLNMSEPRQPAILPGQQSSSATGSTATGSTAVGTGLGTTTAVNNSSSGHLTKSSSSSMTR